MIKRKIIWAAVLLIIALAGGLMYAYSALKPKSSSEVEIMSDGKVLYTIDLTKETDRLITVEYEGRKNVIAVENGDIYMQDADCPDHICINTGRLSRAGVPIVCLPNKLIIKYKDIADSDLDATAN